MCIFTDEELGKLFKHTMGNVNFRCGAAIDVGPDLSVWACFPLSGYNKHSLLEFQNHEELCHCFADFHNSIRIEVGGIFEKCDSCQHRIKGLCSGGCLSHSLNKFVKEERIRNAQVYPNTLE